MNHVYNPYQAEINLTSSRIKEALNEKRSSRDYLYGRLLAVADNIESWSLKKSAEKRDTNAMRFMQRFADRPYSTWRTIELSLRPYISKLGTVVQGKVNLLSEITDLFESPEEYMDDKKLSGEFLLGFHSQREALKFKKPIDVAMQNETEEINEKGGGENV